MKKNNGFTLVELVVVLVVLSIVAISAFPNLSLTQGYNAASERDQLVAMLRSVQTRAMQNTQNDNTGADNFCHRVLFANSNIAMAAQDANGACTNNFFVAIDDVNGYLNLVSESTYTARNAGGVNIAFIDFDDMGRPVPQNRYTITFGGLEAVCIETEGYIHAC